MGTEEGYLLDNAQREAGIRFQALGELFDPGTFRRIEALGTGPDLRVWEVGAGGPTVPAWLATRFGDVLATDLDTSWFAAAPGVRARRHDVAEPPPEHGFDLVHVRLVLVHVPERDRALRHLVDALRPGGWLLVEEADPALQPLACLDEHGPEQELANRLRRGFRELLAGRGVDLAYGRKLPRLLRTAGLVDVQADAYFPITSPACSVLEAATVRQLRDRLVANGLATAAEIDQHLANVDAGRLDPATSPMISAWGHKPDTSGARP
jgi:trans-aconitate methyltransferase